MRLAVKDESFAEVQTLRQRPAGPQDSPSIRTLRQSLPLTVQGQTINHLVLVSKRHGQQVTRNRDAVRKRLQEGKAGVRYSSQELRVQGCFM